MNPVDQTPLQGAENGMKPSGKSSMRKFIETLEVTGIGLVAMMDESTGRKLYSRLSKESTQFGFFSREEAHRLVDKFRNFKAEINLLRPPFSPDHAGGIGDCIVCCEGEKLFTIQVSVRGRICISESDKISCWGGGKVFIKVNRFMYWETCSEEDAFLTSLANLQRIFGS